MPNLLDRLFGNSGWIQGGLTGTWNNLQNYYGQGMEWARAAGLPVFNQAPTGMNQANQFLYGTPEGYPGALTDVEDQLRQYGNFQSMAPAFYQNALGPQGMGFVNTLGNQGLNAYNMSNLPAYYMNTGGQTDSSRQLYEEALRTAYGMGSQAGTLGDVGQSLLGGRGQSAYTQNLQDVASRMLSGQMVDPALQSGLGYSNAILGGGGATPNTYGLSNYGANMLNTGGLTPTGQVGEAAALQFLMSGGQTPLTNQLQNSAMQLVGRDVVPYRGSLVSQAVDQAGDAARRASEAAYRKILAYGGDLSVQNGMRNQAMLANANDIAAQQSAAIRDAQAKEIAAELQQQQLASNYGLQAAQQQQQNLGTSGNILGNLENLAVSRLNLGTGAIQGAEQLQNQRLLQALGILPNLANVQAQNTSLYGNLGLAAGQQEQAGMNLGGNLLNNYLASRQAGLNTGANIAGLENSMFNTAGGLYGNLLNTGGGLTNQAMSGLLSGYNTGLNQASGLYGNYFSGFQPRNTAANTIAGLYGTNLSGLSTLAGQGMNLAQTSAGAQPGLWGGQMTNGIFPSMVGAAANMAKLGD